MQLNAYSTAKKEECESSLWTRLRSRLLMESITLGLSEENHHIDSGKKLPSKLSRDIVLIFNWL